MGRFIGGFGLGVFLTNLFHLMSVSPEQAVQNWQAWMAWLGAT